MIHLPTVNVSRMRGHLKAMLDRPVQSFAVKPLGLTLKVVTASFATANGTATAGVDYPAASGALTFPRDSSRRRWRGRRGRRPVELDETFFVNLSNPA